MKKRFVLSLLSAMLLTGAFAQNQVIKANPLGFLIGVASISYEKAIKEKSAIQVNVNFGGLTFGDAKYSQFGAGFDYKFYLSQDEEAPRGFYAAPGIVIGRGSVKVGSVEDGITLFGPRGIVGYQWIWDSGFALDLFGGIAYYVGGDIKISNVSYGKYSGAAFNGGVAIGYAFGGK